MRHLTKIHFEASGIDVFSESKFKVTTTFFDSDPKNTKFPFSQSVSVKTTDEAVRALDYPIFAQMCNARYHQVTITPIQGDNQTKSFVGYITATKVTKDKIDMQFITNTQAWYWNLGQLSWSSIEGYNSGRNISFTYSLSSCSTHLPGSTGAYICIPPKVRHPFTVVTNYDNDISYVCLPDLIPAVNVNLLIDCISTSLNSVGTSVDLTPLKSVFQDSYLTLQRFGYRTTSLANGDKQHFYYDAGSHLMYAGNGKPYNAPTFYNRQINFIPNEQPNLAKLLGYQSNVAVSIHSDDAGAEYWPYLYFQGQPVRTPDGGTIYNESFFIIPDGSRAVPNGQGTVYHASDLVQVVAHSKANYACWRVYSSHWNSWKDEHNESQYAATEWDGFRYYSTDGNWGRKNHGSQHDDQYAFAESIDINSIVSNSSVAEYNSTQTFSQMMSGMMSPQELIKELVTLSNAYIDSTGHLGLHDVPGSYITRLVESDDVDWSNTKPDLYSILRFKFDDTDQAVKYITDIPILMGTDNDLKVNAKEKKIESKFKLPGVEALGHDGLGIKGGGACLTISNYDSSGDQIDLSGCLVKVDYNSSIPVCLLQSYSTSVKANREYMDSDHNACSVVPFCYDWQFSSNINPDEGGFAMPKDLFSSWAAYISCYSNLYLSSAGVTRRDVPAYATICSFSSYDQPANVAHFNLTCPVAESAESYMLSSTDAGAVVDYKALVLPEPPTTQMDPWSDMPVEYYWDNNTVVFTSAFLINGVSLAPTHGASTDNYGHPVGLRTHEVSVSGIEAGTYCCKLQLEINNCAFDYIRYICCGNPSTHISVEVNHLFTNSNSVYWAVDLGHYSATLKSFWVDGISASKYDLDVLHGIISIPSYSGDFGAVEWAGVIRCLGVDYPLSSRLPHVFEFRYDPETGCVTARTNGEGSYKITGPEEFELDGTSALIPHFGEYIISAIFTYNDVSWVVDTKRVKVLAEDFYCVMKPNVKHPDGTPAEEPYIPSYDPDREDYINPEDYFLDLYVDGWIHHKDDVDLTTRAILPTRVHTKWVDDFDASGVWYPLDQTEIKLTHQGKFILTMEDNFGSGASATKDVYAFDYEYYPVVELETYGTYTTCDEYHGRPWVYEVAAPSWSAFPSNCRLYCLPTQSYESPYRPWRRSVPENVHKFWWNFDVSTSAGYSFTWYNQEGYPTELTGWYRSIDYFGYYKCVIFYNGAYLDTLEYTYVFKNYYIRRRVYESEGSQVVDDYLTLKPFDEGYCALMQLWVHPDGTETGYPPTSIPAQCCLVDRYGWYKVTLYQYNISTHVMGDLMYEDKYRVEYPTVDMKFDKDENILVADLSNTESKQGDAWKIPTLVGRRWLYNGVVIHAALPGAGINIWDPANPEVVSHPTVGYFTYQQYYTDTDEIVVSELYYFDGESLTDSFHIEERFVYDPYLTDQYLTLVPTPRETAGFESTVYQWEYPEETGESPVVETNNHLERKYFGEYTCKLYINGLIYDIERFTITPPSVIVDQYAPDGRHMRLARYYNGTTTYGPLPTQAFGRWVQPDDTYSTESGIYTVLAPGDYFYQLCQHTTSSDMVLSESSPYIVDCPPYGVEEYADDLHVYPKLYPYDFPNVTFRWYNPKNDEETRVSSDTTECELHYFGTYAVQVCAWGIVYATYVYDRVIPTFTLDLDPFTSSTIWLYEDGNPGYPSRVTVTYTKPDGSTEVYWTCPIGEPGYYTCEVTNDEDYEVIWRGVYFVEAPNIAIEGGLTGLSPSISCARVQWSTPDGTSESTTVVPSTPGMYTAECFRSNGSSLGKASVFVPGDDEDLKARVATLESQVSELQDRITWIMAQMSIDESQLWQHDLTLQDHESRISALES